MNSIEQRISASRIGFVDKVSAVKKRGVDLPFEAAKPQFEIMRINLKHPLKFPVWIKGKNPQAIHTSNPYQNGGDLDQFIGMAQNDPPFVKYSY